MEEINCEICNKKFERKKSQIKLAIKHYCSRICSEKGRRKGKLIECFVCKTSIYKSLKDIKLSKSGKYFCGHICGNQWIGEQQRAENNPNWLGGRSSYKELLKREDIKKQCILCKKNDVRILCVHHLDRNRKNNKISNLVWLCRNCHFLVHNYKKEIK